mgnify:CR=1 FL=1
MPVGYIYKLESSFEDPGLYVGSTKDLTRRKYDHKSDCNNPNSNRYNYKLYQYIRDYGGFNNWFMLTLEEFEYEDKKELREREQYWIKKLGADLNMIDAIMDINYHKNYEKKRYQENREKLLKKWSEKFDCECGGKYTHSHKTRHINSKKHQSYLSSKII